MSLKTQINQLFQKRLPIEIIEVSPQVKEKLLKKAESFVIKILSNRPYDGGTITEIDRAMVRSLVELFARKKAMEYKEGYYFTMNEYVYEEAVKNFMEFIKENISQLNLLRTLWLMHAKLCVIKTFTEARKVFEPYLIGELCEKLYLDNRGAQAVLEELKRTNFLKVVDKKYGQNLLTTMT